MTSDRYDDERDLLAMAKFIVICHYNNENSVCKFRFSCIFRIYSLLWVLPCNINPLNSKGNYSATSNDTKLVHWPLMDLVQRGGAWAGCGPAQSSPRCTKCNSPPINGQCINHCIAI